MVNAAELNGDRAGDQGTTTETHHRQSGHQAIIASPVPSPGQAVPRRTVLETRKAGSSRPFSWPGGGRTVHRDGRLTGEPEPPGSVGGQPEPDAWSVAYPVDGRGIGCELEGQRAVGQVQAVVREVHAEGAAEACGAPGQVAVADVRASYPGEVETLDHLSRT